MLFSNNTKLKKIEKMVYTLLKTMFILAIINEQTIVLCVDLRR